MDSAPRLTFYFRQECHLCEEMWQELQQMPGFGSLSVERIDITARESLERRFGTLIPVLAAGERILCNYYLDPMSLRPFLPADV
jgi:hypothetical protein